MGPAAAAQAPVAVPAPSAPAVRYDESSTRLWFAHRLWHLALPALFLATGLSARLAAWARRQNRHRAVADALYFWIALAGFFVLELPLLYQSDVVHNQAYGLSNQSFGRWLADQGVCFLLVALVGGLAVPVLYRLLRGSPRRWWLYTGLLAAPAIAFLLWVGPLAIDPLFNHPQPMRDRGLEAEILELASRAGIDQDRVYEVAKSGVTQRIDAYVIGFLGTQRIVVWDTLLKHLDRREVLFAMGHEMGHYVLGHVPRLFGVFVLLLLAALFLVHRTAPWVLSRLHDRIGFASLGDVASLPLLFILGNLAFLLVLPVGLAYSRQQETEADRFALELTQDGHSAALAFVKLQQHNLTNPNPGALRTLFRASHPSLVERIAFANRYRPWETGEPLRYGRLFSPGARAAAPPLAASPPSP
ncbi:MAG TPA: M48 family metallopeptidase [Thermoanaerobaculia bacterium]